MKGSASRAFGITTDEGVPWTLYQEPQWYACHTRARHEKRVSELLGERGFEAYLPVVDQERRWSDRIKRVRFPLFPGYVFGRFMLRALHEVLAVPGVATVVRHAGQPAPISEWEMENVRRFEAGLVSSGQVAEPRHFEEGQRVRVISGPFEGVEGVVVERRGRSRVLVGLATIGQGLEVDIARRMLQPIRSALRGGRT